MRDATDIHIQELIIHILDPQGQGMVLSHVPLPIQGEPPLLDYFSNHIQTTLRDASLKAARFRNINPEQPSGFCQAILSGSTSLADGSRLLAASLYQIMENDHRITAGDLAVMVFGAGNYPYSRFLAIIKIDPSQIFRHVIREDKRGNVYVSFEPESTAFTGERLQKCAVIQPLDPRHPNFDMLLLDRQSSQEERSVARFFTETFLDAQEAFDPRKYTERFYRSVIEAQNRVRDRMTPDEEAALEENLLKTASSARLNCDAWLEKLPVSKLVLDEIDNALRENIPERQFNMDKSLSQRMTSRIRLRGDHGFRLEIPAENYYTIVISEERISNDPKRKPYYRIVLETEEWERLV